MKEAILRNHGKLLPLDARHAIRSAMLSEFDPAKDEANITKHGVSLAFGMSVFADDDMIVIPTIRIEDGERRFRAIGMVDGKLWTAVHVVRSGGVRFISVRRSNHGEGRAYRA